MIHYSFHHFYNQAFINKEKKVPTSKNPTKISNNKVCFSKIIYVYLIPIYYEIPNYNDLWWSENELLIIRNNAIKEIQQYMDLKHCIIIKDVQKLLYQPNNIQYNATNFETI